MKYFLKSLVPLTVAFSLLFVSCSGLEDLYEPEPKPELTSLVKLNRNTCWLEEGDEVYLEVEQVIPERSRHSLLWSSSDTTLVTVDVFGCIRALHEGKAFIKVTAPDSGVCDSCEVKVKRLTRCLSFSTENEGESSVFTMTDMRAAIEYSYNRVDWMTYKDGTPLAFGKETLYLRGLYNNSEVSGLDMTIGHIHFEGNAKVRCTGSIMNLLNYNDPDCRTLFRPYVLECLFENCVQLTEAPELPATTLSLGCYRGMFLGCTGLTKAPALPATSLSALCYQYMFYGCTSLIEAPDTLPAWAMEYGSCEYMFAWCTSLVAAPALPATELDELCYSSMFSGCTSLTKAPELSAAKLIFYCYCSMFSGCTSLTAAPALPATQLAESCYRGMFSDCTSLAKAPELPATTIDEYAYSCYKSMFSGCTALTEAPVLPSAKLSGYCYENMFSGCTALTEAPALPATELKTGCYQSMFEGCGKLTKAPELLSRKLEYDCYTRMFVGCESLRYVKAMFVDYSYQEITDMVDPVSWGTFVKNVAATWPNEAVIKSGWTIEYASE